MQNREKETSERLYGYCYDPEHCYLAFYKKRGNLLDCLIRLFTLSKYSHVEIVVQNIQNSRMDWYSSSPRDGGVRIHYTKLKWLSKETLEAWDVIEIPTYAISSLPKFFENTCRKKYDYLGALGFLFRWLPQSKKRYFCSEWVAGVLGLPKAHQYTPEDLHQWAVNVFQNGKG